MPNTISRIVHFIAIMSISSTISICHAITANSKVIIKCSTSPDTATWQRLEGNPDIKLSLTTDGIKTADENIPIIDWEQRNGGPIDVLARCVPSINNMVMFPKLNPEKQFSINIPTLICQKGQGIEIIMKSPNDSDPNKYQYIAILTIEMDDEEFQTNTTEIETNSQPDIYHVTNDFFPYK